MTSPLPSLTVDPEADAGGDFEVFDRLIGESGPVAAIDRLIASLEARDEARPLLDALLLKARHELGLPFVQDGSLADIPEPIRSKYEDRYVEAIRHVGGKLLRRGDIAAAWPYFRDDRRAEARGRCDRRGEPGAGGTKGSARSSRSRSIRGRTRGEAGN